LSEEDFDQIEKALREKKNYDFLRIDFSSCRKRGRRINRRFGVFLAVAFGSIVLAAAFFRFCDASQNAENGVAARHCRRSALSSRSSAVLRFCGLFVER
jgi:hypothetical protein